MSQNDFKDKKIDAKFDFIVNDMDKSSLVDNKLFNELENHLQSKFISFIKRLQNKIEVKCKEDIEKLRIYSDYKGDFFKGNKNSQITDLEPTKGYEKEFEAAMNQFKLCVDKTALLETEVNNHSKTLSDLTLFSHDTCLNQCRTDLKKNKLSENEVRKCIDSCMKYRKYNLEAYYKITYDNIDSKEKLIDKL